MTTRQLNRYAEQVLVCNGDQRYGGEIAADDHVLVGILAGELKVVQANRTHYCGPSDTLLLPRQQPATLLKYPKDGVAHQAVMRQQPQAPASK